MGENWSPKVNNLYVLGVRKVTTCISGSPYSDKPPGREKPPI